MREARRARPRSCWTSTRATSLTPSTSAGSIRSEASRRTSRSRAGQAWKPRRGWRRGEAQCGCAGACTH